jgi:hypothetical protein
MTTIRTPTHLRPGTTSYSIYTATLIAFRYADRLPTCSELRRDFGISRATSYRWQTAIAEARRDAQKAS